ncbi:hypothetical protein GGR55DRAFT_629686 [Xylaria sp. FL0064]|nr:hypothetical protein GGR55DRAFT_629686 [Xylaria sp. FL0064]
MSDMSVACPPAWCLLPACLPGYLPTYVTYLPISMLTYTPPIYISLTPESSLPPSLAVPLSLAPLSIYYVFPAFQSRGLVDNSLYQQR